MPRCARRPATGRRTRGRRRSTGRGTTTEVVAALERVPGDVATVAITADSATPVVEAAASAVVLDFADERSVVQTRFPTTLLLLLRAHLGQDLAALPERAEHALRAELPGRALRARQLAFLGAGWAGGIADEAALKVREAACAWAESYPAMEYRHGPIAVADAST